GIALRPEERSVMVGRLRAACGEFTSVAGQRDREVARLLRDLEADLAADLMGYTRWSLRGIFAHRGAPVQVSSLAYAGHMRAGSGGGGSLDSRMPDPVVMPVVGEHSLTVVVVRMPRCFLPIEDGRALAPGSSRGAGGFPARGGVLCAFTNG